MLLCDRTDSQTPRLERPSLYSVGRLASRYPTPQGAGIPRSGEAAKGETQVTPLRTLVVRALVGALLLVALSAGAADARSHRAPAVAGLAQTQFLLPEDPGLE
jgi:hypothetical protein